MGYTAAATPGAQGRDEDAQECSGDVFTSVEPFESARRLSAEVPAPLSPNYRAWYNYKSPGGREVRPQANPCIVNLASIAALPTLYLVLRSSVERCK